MKCWVQEKDLKMHFGLVSVRLGKETLWVEKDREGKSPSGTCTVKGKRSKFMHVK